MNRVLCVVMVAGALALAAGAARAELVVNGGFEAGDFTGWGTQPAANGSLFGVFTDFQHTGSWSAGFGAVAFEHDLMFQTLPTSAGESYLLSFWVLNFESGEDSLIVLWEGNEVLNQTPVTTQANQWVEITVPLMATTNGSELRFGLHDRPAGVWIDDISVTPEPGTLSLVGVGLLALVRRRMA